MSGVSYDIHAHGSIDKYLTGTPSKTYVRSVHQQHTKFACESLSQPFNTPVQFGQESQILLNRAGDMIYFLYVHVVLPGLVAWDAKDNNCGSCIQFPAFMEGGAACAPCSRMDEAALMEYLPANYNDLSTDDQVDALREAKDIWRREKYGAGRELSCCVDGDADCPDVACPELGDTWCHYCNDVGHFLLTHTKLIIGGQPVDHLWSTFLFCWEELTGKSGRRLTELTGRRYTRSQLVCDSREERELYIPLPFYFTLQSGSALPIAALQFHGVQLNIEFEKLEKLIVVSGSHVNVRNARTGLGLTPNDLRADMEVTYIYLDQYEQNKFQTAHFEQLIVQTQQYIKNESKQICRIQLAFNHPILELIFAVRRMCNERCNNWTNFSGIDGRDPITHAELLLNTTPRFVKKSALYWRGVMPYERHSNLPEAFIYCMCFALDPEASLQPSGSCNFSRIDNIELVLDMQSALNNEAYNVYIYARNWNILRFKDGVCGLGYA